DAVIPPRDYSKRIVAGWIRRSDTIHVIHGGIHLPDGPPDLPPLGPDTIVLTAGRLVPWKGVAALVRLAAEHREWTLVVAGDGPEAGHLRSLARQLNAPVVFAGPVSPDELTTLLRRATVFVLNTAFESFSHQVVEAMHAGVPVVTTWVGSLPELIEDGKSGFLVRPDDTKEIAA